MLAAWVYIIKCAHASYYTGSTTDIDGRITKHHEGYYGGYPSSRRPLELVWSQEFQEISQAIAAERRIKGWSHAKKEALIRGEFDLLRDLSQSKEMKKRRSKRSTK